MALYILMTQVWIHAAPCGLPIVQVCNYRIHCYQGVYETTTCHQRFSRILRLHTVTAFLEMLYINGQVSD